MAGSPLAAGGEGGGGGGAGSGGKRGPRAVGRGGGGGGRVVQKAAVSPVQPFGAVARTHRHRMDDPARRPGGWSVRHRAGPPREEARPTPPRSGPGEVRVPPPRSADPPGPGERDGDGEADRVDCVRIVHWMRNLLGRVPPGQRAMLAAMLRTIFAQDTREAAHERWRRVADGLRERFPRVAELMDGAEHDVLAHRAFPKEHWAQLASTNPLERLN